MGSHDMSSIPSDQALEYLLAQTRAHLTEQVDDEAERVNRDLEDLVHRVRGSQRGARAAVLRQRAQSIVDAQRAQAVQAASHEATAKQSGSVAPTKDVFEPEFSRLDLESLGVPATLLAMRSGHIPTLLSYAPEPIAPSAHPGKVVAVVAREGKGVYAVETAERLARRTPGHASVIVVGTKTIAPGNHVRLTNLGDLDKQLKKRSDTTTYLVLVEADTQAQQRLVEGLGVHKAIEEVWAVVDCDDNSDDVQKWLMNLPGKLSADSLAAFNVWEAKRPAQVLSHSLPVSLLDLAPATPQQWTLIFQAHLH